MEEGKIGGEGKYGGKGSEERRWGKCGRVVLYDRINAYKKENVKGNNGYRHIITHSQISSFETR